jgi:hypothetical protein
MERLINVFMLESFFLFPFVYFLFCTAVFSTIQSNIYYFTYLPTCMSHFNVFRLLFFFFTLLCFLLLFSLLGNYILCLTYRFTLHAFYHGRELNFRFFFETKQSFYCLLTGSLEARVTQEYTNSGRGSVQTWD